MQDWSRTVLLHDGTVEVTASGVNAQVPLPEKFTAVNIMVNATQMDGTSPTLDIYIQQGIRDQGSGVTIGTDVGGSFVWDDYAHLAQITAVSKRFFRIVGSGNEESAASDAALAAATVREGPIGTIWRLKYVISGTNPAIKFSAVAQFIP